MEVDTEARITLKSFCFQEEATHRPFVRKHQDALSLRTSQADLGYSSTTADTGVYVVSSLGASDSSIGHQNYQYPSSLWKDHFRGANFNPLFGVSQHHH